MNVFMSVSARTYMLACTLVPMYVRMYVCMLACMYVCTYVRTYVLMYVGMYVCIFASKHISMYICMYLFAFLYVSIFLDVYAQMHAGMHMQVRMRIFIYSPSTSVCITRNAAPPPPPPPSSPYQGQEAVTTVNVEAPAADLEVDCDPEFVTYREGKCEATVWQGTALSFTADIDGQTTVEFTSIVGGRTVL